MQFTREDNISGIIYISRFWLFFFSSDVKPLISYGVVDNTNKIGNFFFVVKLF